MDIIPNGATIAPVYGKSYALEQNPLLVPPQIARAIGLKEAVVLNQIHYWLEKGAGTVIDGARWIYNTIKEWAEQLKCLSFNQVRRAIQHLEDLQILKSCKPWKREWDQRKAYRIDYDRLKALQGSICHSCQTELANEPNQIVTAANSLTEITPETNLKDNNHVVVEKVFESLNPEKSSEQNFVSTKVALETNPKNPGTHLPPQTQRQDQKNLGGALNVSEILAEVETVVAPKELKPHLHAFVMESIATLGEQAVSDAVAAAKEYKEQQQTKHRKVKNPTGLVRKAITEKWKPNKRSLPRGFKQWIKLARQVGVAIASCFENGALYVFTPDGQRHLYEEYKLIHPIETLRE
ncbi:hypothetical protein Pse7367_3758 (plasmid) [Thalassoporum mexicanum PCC 7367]|uniref:hypothetical protein n=1 Tax=Thalassoporum mexicanum TaxID=3457544 RepID=UPI00029FB591|nr:hypothetical protein [Pseudanabaena sp. PCC 7367]AFY71984.1 hypothetical protein Pse7367_3758 [Pseudanabaena sp. PCC 7367]